MVEYVLSIAPTALLCSMFANRFRWMRVISCVNLMAGCAIGWPLILDCRADATAEEVSYQQVEPILAEYCCECHGYGAAEGGVTLDEFATGEEAIRQRELWWKAIKLLRLKIMPPPDHERLPDEELGQLEKWIKTQVFAIDPDDPDPGRVTLRRLNRVEYRNTIRDLLGVDYNTAEHFPADDTGHGFDNIGDVLTISPLHLEKYIAAAREIVRQAVSGQPLRPDEAASAEQSKQYRRFFPRDVPDGAAERLDYARELLTAFAKRAYRRPVDTVTVDRLTALAEQSYSQPQRTFEAGIAEAMIAVLVSPRFLFRVEELEEASDEAFPLVDEYALTSRLSYFLWSTMPDDELFRLADAGKFRENLSAQVTRMKADRRWQFVRHFAGQWLRARDIVGVNINTDAVLWREQASVPELSVLLQNFWPLQRIDKQDLTEAQRTELAELQKKIDVVKERLKRRFTLDTQLRRAMRRETEMVVAHLFREDRSLLELLDSDYTFLNERLAAHYGVEGIEGNQMRLVNLPADSPRGGVLTQGTVLVTTSNPNRTSPVKRGIFILEDLLGVPPAAPPPDVPSLEEAVGGKAAKNMTLREILAEHRRNPMCSSCHDRMDPLGLALENFNALGLWREFEQGQPIDASGTLVTGRSFDNIRELKRILVEDHRTAFYRCLTEKALVFAIGRGLEYYDVHAVDTIVERLEASGGKPSALLAGIVESAPFQRSRRSDPAAEDRSSQTLAP